MMAFDLSFLGSEQTLIPFLFVLAIVFGVLELKKVFRNRGVNFLVAISIAFFTITNSFFVSMLWAYFGSITAFFIIMFYLAFIFEIFGLRGGKDGKDNTSSIVIEGAMFFVLLSIGFLFVDQIPTLPVIGSGANLITIFLIIFVLSIFWSAFKIGNGDGHGRPQKQ